MTRKELIEKIEKERESKVICYITGDRNPFSTRIASDAVPLISDLLSDMGKPKKVSLFLYTTGGDMLAPIRIVKLIRSHCEKFEVIVPYKAHSAGTLICLGADSIVMSRLGELTPVDPATGHPFNPQNPSNPSQRLEVSVEDLNSYLLFARDKAFVENKDMVEVYKILADKLHPLSIGNAYRAYRMARLITERLLWLHMDKDKDSQKIERIIKEITSDITVHAYPIDRDEAADLGLSVEKASDEFSASMRDLYDSYAKMLKLGQPFNPNELLEGKDMIEISKPAAVIESTEVSYEFTYSGKAQRVIRNNQTTVDLNFDTQIWKKK